MRLLSRRLVPALALPVAVLLAAPGPVLADTAVLGGTSSDGPTGQPAASHRSVPLEPSSTAPARSLPGVQGTDEAGETASSEPTSTATLTLGEGVHVLGLRWEGTQPEAAELRVREPGGAWGTWAPLEDAVPMGPAAVEATAGRTDESVAASASEEPVGDADEVERATTGDVVVGEAEVQVRLVGQAADATVETWSTTRTNADVTSVQHLPVTKNRLVIGTRADWGADESAPRVSDPSDLVHDFPKLGVTIHHTAGDNEYTAEDVPSIIRGIFYYHGQTLRWDDIGYAALVDKYGRVWEGRAGGVEENIQLAHAFGMNRDWTGIAVLGNHEAKDGQVWATELTALSEVTAWNLSTHGVQAGSTVRYTNAYEGWTRTLPVVHAHRDVGMTLCPGGKLYTLMDSLRSMVLTDQRERPQGMQRIGGVDRYDSAAQIARRAFLEGTRTAYLASGGHEADALGVAPVAEAQGAAVLLTRTDSVPEVTMAALRDLGVRQVVLVGGTNAVAPAVEQQLTRANLAVRRVEGVDRFATAAALATQSAQTGRTVYVANGMGLVDALSGGAAAAEQDGVVLLTRRTSLPSVTSSALTALAPARVVVLGGETALSESVRQKIAAAAPGASVERIGGRDRYETSAALATHAFDSSASAVVANGSAAVDAVVGTQLAARHGGPVLLSRMDCRPPAVDQAYQQLGITLSRLAGGTKVLGWSAGDTVCR